MDFTFLGNTKKTETKDDTLDPTYGEVCSLFSYILFKSAVRS